MTDFTRQGSGITSPAFGADGVILTANYFIDCGAQSTPEGAVIEHNVIVTT